MLEVKLFPKDMGAIEIDPSNIKKCLVSGLFKEEVEVQGKKRYFYTYLTPDLEYNRCCLVIAPPDDTDILEFIEKSFWTEFAEKEKVFLHFLSPEEKWNYDGTDADYMNKVYVQIQARKYYVTMQDNIYAFGIGTGAVIAQQAAMKMTSEWSGMATFGDMNESAMLNASAVQKSENMGKVELSISAAKAQLPVWMFWTKNTGDNEKVCQYWKIQNETAEEKFSNGTADEIYFPTTVCKNSQINEEKISQVRVTNGYTGNLTEELFDQVWEFVKRARRHRCYGTKALRYFKDPEEYGAVLHTIQLEGYTRLWYEYVPKRVAEGGKPVPLVVNMHGRGGSAESFMDMSQMNCVAEDRDFIVLFPEASVYQQRPEGVRNILLWEGNYKGKKIDDVAFILAMIEDVKKRYPVDETRIYACGQSSGGMMSSELALKAPGVFAAVAPWSAIKDPDHAVPLREKIEPAVPYLFLFGENDWLCVDKENGKMEYKVAEDIAEFLQNLIRIYDLEETPGKYQCGEITYYVYRNKKKTPMLTVGTVRDMSHANYPWESWTSYDGFLSKFSKKPDGTLLYVGKEAL